MKKTKTLVSIIFLLQLFFLSMSIHAQEGWYSINHVAKGNNMNSIYFVNDSVGYTVSDEGYLFRTTNKGLNWTHTKLSSKSLNDITFKNNAGFVVGDSGKVFRTIDGINWTELTSGTTNKLRAVWFVDADTGYVFGDNSTILKTINSGETWNKADINPGLTITDGAFSTPDFGMCSTLEGVLIRTADYGRTWQYYGVSANDEFYSITFADSATAYIAGFEMDGSLMLKTTDRGEHFRHLYNIPRFASTCFFNSDTGYIAGEFGAIGKTTDGGINWEWQKSFTYKTLNSIFFLNENNGYACGKDSTILKTTDGGLNWDLLGSGHTSQIIDVYFSSENTGYAVGSNGSNGIFLKTTDAGKNWKLSDYGSYDLSSVYFLNTDTGFIGSRSHKLFSTTDGGINWKTFGFSSQNLSAMTSIKFCDKSLGIIVAGEKFLKTTDGGITWTEYNCPTFCDDINFLDKNNIIAIGESTSSIYKSTDGGNSWLSKYSSPGKILYLHSTSFLDDKTGCTVGSNGIILRTTDGGETWVLIPSGTTHALLKIKLLSNSSGYIVGDHGVILYTKDAGLNWSLQNSNTSEDLFSIFFTNLTTGYIVGNSGTILKTVNGGITGIEKNNKIIPSEFKLYQNYPNPFNPSTLISYQIPSLKSYSNVPVQLKVYDITGREIKTLINEEQSPGTYKIYFNGSNLSSGVYYYRITAGSFTQVKKMLLLK